MVFKDLPESLMNKGVRRKELPELLLLQVLSCLPPKSKRLQQALLCCLQEFLIRPTPYTHGSYSSKTRRR